MTDSTTPKHPSTQPATLASVIRQARETAGLSIRQLAPLAGLHYSVLSRIETGAVTRPSPEMVQRLADVLELDATELLAFIGVKPSSVLPAPRMYFRRAYGMTDEEAQETAARIEEIIAELRANKGSDRKNRRQQAPKKTTKATKRTKTTRGGTQP